VYPKRHCGLEMSGEQVRDGIAGHSAVFLVSPVSRALRRGPGRRQGGGLALAAARRLA